MYAEQFNAPSWMEEPAQWLWWAMQSRLNGDLKDSQYNLGQFWKALDGLKASATDATWPEILALDSQSHIQAANLTSAIINQMEKNYNDYAFMFNFPFIGDKNQPVQAPKESIKAQQDQRLQELQKAADLAAQAQTADAARVEAVASGRIDSDEAERAQENTQIDRITRDQSPLSFGNVPTWAWIAGGLGLFLILKGR